MKQWALDPRFVEPMKHICGDEAPALFTEKLNLKRPHVGGPNPLHQDYPYWLDLSDDPLRLATAMIFLDDSTVERCLQVLPGSDLRGVAARRTDADDFGNNEMDPRPFADSQLVPVEVPAGSVVYFGPLLVHMSEMNTSDRERRALLFSHGPRDQRHLSDILAEGIARRNQPSATGLSNNRISSSSGG
jgi:ectoine hydroxylase-related dioxygenase (phytanoyl-CoA dioxygenase family)